MSSMMVKSVKDGCWYYEHTEWKFALDYLCDCLSCFSEDDLNDELYIILDHVAVKISEKIKKNEC